MLPGHDLYQRTACSGRQQMIGNKGMFLHRPPLPLETEKIPTVPTHEALLVADESCRRASVRSEHLLSVPLGRGDLFVAKDDLWVSFVFCPESPGHLGLSRLLLAAIRSAFGSAPGMMVV